ncbi:synaptophysin-like protein 2 [Esox lucius]|uniref:MARVEL domain-containing protein n=1 Tax=Esox lucius TaxID=8010 RepID=A0A3P8ZMS6_ESOLU|nr:synaptophysin-like protein 2 [Esox lucius]
MVTQSRMDFAPVKEPLGFIKILEWLTAALAFGSCGGYSGTNAVTISCGENRSETLIATVNYPFRLNQLNIVEFNKTLCNYSTSASYLTGDYAVPAEIYVDVGIASFTYCMVTLLFYVCYMNAYTRTPIWPKTDFVVTVLFAVFWLISASLWAIAVQHIITAVDSNSVNINLSVCREIGVVCAVAESKDIRDLKLSVNCGFLNVILWMVNIFFTYKKTPWHNQRKTIHYQRLGTEHRLVRDPK